MNARSVSPTIKAPWAESVGGDGSVTVDDLLSWPDDGWRYEVVEGVLVRVAGSGARAATIARRLATRLGDYVDRHDLGIVTGAAGVFTFPNAETGLLPDVGFLTTERADRIVDWDRPIPVPPDLAVEVATWILTADLRREQAIDHELVAPLDLSVDDQEVGQSSRRANA